MQGSHGHEIPGNIFQAFFLSFGINQMVWKIAKVAESQAVNVFLRAAFTACESAAFCVTIGS